jgi:transcription factor C subunit 7
MVSDHTSKIAMASNVINRRFSGDESFSTNPGQGAAGLDAGSGLGVVIEGNKPEKPTEPSRL